MAQYYTKIRLGRMATLLALTEAETEDCLSDMVRNLIIVFLSLTLVAFKIWTPGCGGNSFCEDWQAWGNCRLHRAAGEIVQLLVLLTPSQMQHAVTGPLGKPQHLELQHKQADGLGHEDHPPHQQGGDGELIWRVLETKVFNSCQYFLGSQNPRSRSCGGNWVILPGASELSSLHL